MRYVSFAALIFGVSLPFAAVQSAQAQTAPKLEATFSDWDVHTHGSGKNRVCYALSKPTSMAPTNVNHGDVFFLVSSWDAGKPREQPSLRTGYALKVRTPPRARIGSTKINMFVAGEEAFVEDDGEENTLVKKMRAGSNLRVEATSGRGTSTSYEFSLKGVTAAIRKANALCN